MNKIISWYKRDRKVLLASLLCGLIITTGAGMYSRHHSYQTLEAISSQILRFHVLPNSDSEADLALKTRVKEEVLGRYHEALLAMDTIEESRKFLIYNLNDIEDFAGYIVRSEGFDYPVNVSLGNSMFPTRRYGELTLPAGSYEALRIEIGGSGGSNWWCVMFPPLCFVDVTRSEVSPLTRESFMNLLSEEDFALLDNGQRESDPLIRVRFRIVEWWQDNGFEEDEIILVQAEGLGF